MPVLTTATAFDMHNIEPIYLPVDSAGSSKILDVHLETYEVDKDYSTGWTIYSGSFSYDDMGNVSGTVFSISIYEGTFAALSTGGYKLDGTLQQSLTGLNKSASTVQAYYENEDAQGLIEYLLNGNDSITGSPFSDVLDGFAGDDNLIGGSGNDLLYGGAGSDTLNGGADNDWLIGGDLFSSTDSSPDTLHGGGGADTLIAGSGADTLTGDTGSDQLSGGAGADTVEGGDGDDTLIGGEGVDHLSGDAGSDFLNGGADGDSLNGGGDNDKLAGGAGDDLISGGDGFDEVQLLGPGSTYNLVLANPFLGLWLAKQAGETDGLESIEQFSFYDVDSYSNATASLTQSQAFEQLNSPEKIADLKDQIIIAARHASYYSEMENLSQQAKDLAQEQADNSNYLSRITVLTQFTDFLAQVAGTFGGPIGKSIATGYLI